MSGPSKSDLNEPRELFVGTHAAGFVPPDAYTIRQVGDLDKEQVMAIFDAIDGFVAGKGPVFAVIYLSGAGKVTSDARKLLLARMPASTVGVVFVNVPTMARIGLSLGYKAYVMMSRGKEQPHTFVDDEAQAFTWITERRRQNAANAAG